MPLKKLKFRPGVNKENTSLSVEGGWYACDKIRFRQGTPEKLGGWTRMSSDTYQGICRSLIQWVTLSSALYTAVGTHLKFYVESGGEYFDITPLRSTVVLNGPFDTTDGDATVTVNDVAHGGVTGDFVTFSGAAAVAGLDLNNEYQITVIDDDTYTIEAASPASGTVSGGGGATVTAAYQINIGLETQGALNGWGSGGWGLGTWGTGGSTALALRIWTQANFGEDLVFAPKNGAIYFWDSSSGLTARGVEIGTLPGASDTPDVTTFVMVSDVSRFVLAFGANPFGSAVQNPMLIRWSDQESVVDWTPSITSQAGELTLSTGSAIIAAVQTRQEILVLTDQAVYSFQYVGAPDVWTASLLGDNISIASNRCAIAANNSVYWMGVDKFYTYNGRVQTLNCDLWRHVYSDINLSCNEQFFAAAVESFNEVWWFYCSSDSSEVDRYVIFNYAENAWYYGSMNRTAWFDSQFGQYPLAADPDNHNLLYHEFGVDDAATGENVAIEAYIETAEFDIDDGDQFSFVWRLLPDVTFQGSTTPMPALTMQLIPLKAPGSGYNSPKSVGGQDVRTVTRSATVPIEAFTQQVNIRVRGRQLIMRVESTGLGVNWQLGTPAIDIRPDGRRG